MHQKKSDMRSVSPKFHASFICIFSAGFLFMKCTHPPPVLQKCPEPFWKEYSSLQFHQVKEAAARLDALLAKGDTISSDSSDRVDSTDTTAAERLSGLEIRCRLFELSIHHANPDYDLDKISEYACEDADIAFRLREILEPRLKKDDLMALFQTVEMPLVSVLMMLEENGVYLDTEMLSQMSAEMQRQLNDIELEIYEAAGEKFNINSTQQLGRILFEKLKVHELIGQRRARRTKTGYSTDVRVLESLAAHPLARKLLDFRQLTKLKSTYVDALPALINSKSDRIHASFNQTVAATGRLSTSNPNLQNIPVRTELGREIRKAFIAQKKDWMLLSADYSQIELRLMAHLSGDKTLKDSFRNNEDVHRRTASEIFGLPINEITDDHRRQAKTINFGETII